MKTFFTLLAGLVILNASVAVGQTVVGSLDTTYGQGGKVETYFNGISGANAEALQSDGKIVVTGYSYDSSKDVFTTIRYNTDGSVDTDFAVEGSDTISFSNGNNIATSIAVQKNGKIIVAGYAAKRIAKNDSVVKSYLIRFNTNGSIDSTFGTNGIAIDSIGRIDNRIYGISIQPDGKIVAAGSTVIKGSTQNIEVLRYDSTGVPDVSFNDSGSVTTMVGTNSYARAITIQKDNKLVVTGTGHIGGYDYFSVARYDTNGVLDGTFGTGGIVSASAFYADEPYAIVLQNDTNIIVGGYAYIRGTKQNVFALAKFNKAGVLDTSFGVFSTRTIITPGAIDDEVRGLAVDSNGKLLVAGFTENSDLQYEDVLARYNTGGVNDSTCLPDSTFGSDTTETFTTFGLANSYANAILIQHNDNIVLAGYALVGSKGLFTLARYLIDTIHVSTSGIDFVTGNNSMRVYPNPIQREALLSYSLNHDETVTIKVYDVLGRTVQTIMANNSQTAGNYTESLNVAALPPGIYFINLSNSLSQNLSIKIVKQ